METDILVRRKWNGKMVYGQNSRPIGQNGMDKMVRINCTDKMERIN